MPCGEDSETHGLFVVIGANFHIAPARSVIGFSAAAFAEKVIRASHGA
jgi:hypothetical protein